MSSRPAYLFLLPALLLYAAFVVVPILQVAAYSLFSWDNGIAQDFVGLRQLCASWIGRPVFWAALGHNAIWVVLTLAFPLLAGLLLAAILAERSPRTVQVMSAIYFIPRTIPLVVAGIIWGWIYNPLFGLLNYGLDHGRARQPGRRLARRGEHGAAVAQRGRRLDLLRLLRGHLSRRHPVHRPLAL